MKQVVIVAPQFPPCNLTAGHRSRYLGIHLLKFGWKVKILSVKPHFYEGMLDHELEKMVPDELEVIRTNAMPIGPFRLVGDIGIRSFLSHYLTLSNLITKEKIDLIYIPIPPNYSALLGPLMYRKFGTPYAIDYIDPWISSVSASKTLLSKAWFSHKIGGILEPIALKHVSLVTGVAPGYYQRCLEHYPWLNASRCLAIPYGIEENDFRYLDNHSRAPYVFGPDDGNCHIVYAGAMLPKAYSTLNALFEGVLIFKKRWPDMAQKLRLHFIGTGKNPNDAESFSVRLVAKKYNLLDTVFEHPKRIPYLDVLNHLRYAHAILILGSSESHYTPSKVFQAILARKSILALLHSKSTAVKVLEGTEAGITVVFNEEKPVSQCTSEISEALNKIASYKNSAKEVNKRTLNDYAAETMAEKLSHAFDRILEKRKSDNAN